MLICSYIVKHDYGLAPNPFWGYCTLAVCTPNHMGVKLQKGDWIMGTSPTSQESKLIYLMQISEILPFDAYYHDKRFKTKIPNIHGSWKERCGDNMYFKDQSGMWNQHPTIYHRDSNIIEKDLRYPHVFIAEVFYYFGDKTIKIPDEFQELIWKRQGCKQSHNPGTVKNFLQWVQDNFPTGILGNPKDNPKIMKAESNNSCH